MNRRSFFRTALLGGSAAGAALLLPVPAHGAGTKAAVPAADPEQVGKVQRAMLSMQRYAWEQGVAAQAVLEWGDDPDLLVLMAKDAVLRQWPDGRLAVVSENHGVTDPAANGEPVLVAARMTGDKQLAAGAQGMLDYLLDQAPRTKDGTLYHIDDKPQVWIDSMYMSPPFLAAAGRPAVAIEQIEGMRKLLWNQEKKLFSQIWDDGKGDFHNPAHWGVGNGWAAAGITRVIRNLPQEQDQDKARLIGYVKQIIDGCLAHQRPDGLFHNVVDDPSTFIETNLAQMLSYSIYRGLAGGWLDDCYRKPAEKMRQASLAKIDQLGLVQGVCGAPNFESSGTAVEGQAFMILMQAACRDWQAHLGGA